MKKTILFIILNQFTDWECAYVSSALYLLGVGQYEVKTVSLTKDKVVSIGGFHVVPDYDLASMPKEYEGMVLVGGLSWRTKEARQLEPYVRTCYEEGKVLGAICDASAFLATTGVLNDVKHTSNDLNDIKAWAGEAYTGESNYIMKQAVRDQTVITANGTAPLEFGKEVLLALQVASEEKINEWYNFHKLGYYTATYPKM